MARRAVNVGVDLVPGTDGRYDPTTKLRLPLEIRELVAIGMPPMRAIQAATSVAAASLNIDDRTGSVRPGMEADLIAVNGNPLDDVAVLGNPVLIINDGRIVREPPKK
jgi:imidazolonepropionase-like amidohydrolase